MQKTVRLKTLVAVTALLGALAAPAAVFATCYANITTECPSPVNGGSDCGTCWAVTSTYETVESGASSGEDDFDTKDYGCRYECETCPDTWFYPEHRINGTSC